jgi:hypothetical protein
LTASLFGAAVWADPGRAAPLPRPQGHAAHDQEDEMHSTRMKDEFGRTEGHVLFDADFWRVGTAVCDDESGRRLWKLYDNAGEPIRDENGQQMALWTLGDARAAMAMHHAAAGSPRPAP